MRTLGFHKRVPYLVSEEHLCLLAKEPGLHLVMELCLSYVKVCCIIEVVSLHTIKTRCLMM